MVYRAGGLQLGADVDPGDPDASLLALQLAWWEQAEQELRRRLRERDATMTEEYLRGLRPGTRDLWFIF